MGLVDLKGIGKWMIWLVADWWGLEGYFLRVMGLIPTQWTSTYVLVDGRWLNKLLRPPGLVDIVDRWKNDPMYAE